MKHCDKCVSLVEDNVSLCEECRTYVPLEVNWEEKARMLKELFETHKGKGEKYDAIVLYTGGKDSSFVLYYLTKVLKARVLAFTWDNKMFSDSALDNLRRSTEVFGVDHRFSTWDHEKFKVLLKAIYKTVGITCFCPFFALMEAIPIAISEKIPFIVHGTTGQHARGDCSYHIPDQTTQKKDITAFYNTWSGIFNMALKRNEPKRAKEIQDHICGFFKPHVQPDAKVDFYPYILPLCNYVAWLEDIPALMKILKDHFDWNLENSQLTHTSCMIEPVRGYLEYNKGLTGLINETNWMVRDGNITREKGLEEFDAFCYDGRQPPADVVKLFCKSINITEEEFEKHAKEKMSLWLKLKSAKLFIEMTKSFSWYTNASDASKQHIMKRLMKIKK